MTDNDDLEINDYADRKRYDDQFRMKPRLRSLVSRGSKLVEVEEFDEESQQWRRKLKMSRIKFDEKAKGVFLDEYSKWGRIGEASAAAGVTTQTVRKAIEEDEDFAEAMLIAEEDYRDKLISHHQNLVFNGTQKENYDRNGNLVSRETIYPIRLIELELKKHDPGYRDKQEIAVNHTGGVLLAPAEMNSIEDWEQRFSKAKDVTPKGPTESVRISLQDQDEEDAF
jgi:hypothetical protein